MRVLLVEDDPLMGEILSVGLQEGSHDVVLRANASAAQDILSHPEGDSIELLVSDINLGAGDTGLDLAAYCASAHPDLRVILVSGHPRSKFEAKLNELDGVEFMQKPVPLDALLGAVAGDRRAPDGWS